MRLGVLSRDLDMAMLWHVVRLGVLSRDLDMAMLCVLGRDLDMVEVYHWRCLIVQSLFSVAATVTSCQKLELLRWLLWEAQIPGPSTTTCGGEVLEIEVRKRKEGE